MEQQEFDLLKKDSFKVPDGYFEAVDHEVMNKLRHAETSWPHTGNVHVTSGRGKGLVRKLAVAVAAVAAVFILIFYFPRESNSSYNLTELNEADIIEYLSLNADELEIEYLMSQAEKIQPPQEEAIGKDGQSTEYLLDEFETTELLK